MYASILASCSPNTAKYFLRILHRHIYTFHAFSGYAERKENSQKEIYTFNNAWQSKGTLFRKNRIGDHKLAYDETNYKFILVIFNLKSTLNSEKSLENPQLILDQNHKFLNDKKNISRYCPFKAFLSDRGTLYNPTLKKIVVGVKTALLHLILFTLQGIPFEPYLENIQIYRWKWWKRVVRINNCM